MTSTEWWELLEDNWDDLTNLVDNFHPDFNDFDKNRFPITARAAESACEVVRQEIRGKVNQDPVMSLIDAKHAKDVDLACNILNETWFGMPESQAVHSIPGFSVLCDLLSDCPGEQ